MDKWFVDGWRGAWRWVSVQFGLAASLFIGWIFSSPYELLTLLNGIPYELRVKLSPLVSIGVFALVVVLRLLKQRGAK